MRVLLIEDDEDLCRELRPLLERSGFAVDISHSGVEGRYLGDEGIFDAAILDLGLPDLSGLEVLGHWRAAGNSLLVLILTARDAWYERVEGFRLGADDYLGKPFHPEELLARLQALLRRRHDHTGGERLRAAGLSLDETTQSVEDGAGRVHTLTGIEFRLLRYLMLHPGQVLSKSHLTERLYDDASDRDSNVLEVYVNRLRQKLGKGMIRTRRGQGYVFGEGPCGP